MMKIMTLKDSIRTVPDFPVPGVQFKDITSILESPTAFNECMNAFANIAIEFCTTQVIGIDSRGFIFGSCLAYDLTVPLTLARKPSKLPNPSYKRDYSLEYGKASLEIQQCSALACASIVHEEFNVPKENILVLSVIDLPYLHGSEKLCENGYNVKSLVEFNNG
jgi:adenine phosphoribosyltransferase